MIASTVGSASSGIPFVATALIGREDLVARIQSLITHDKVRLLTLFGPGGVGKTRVAVAVAEALAGGFIDGAIYVSLAAIRHSDLVVPTIAEAVELFGDASRPLAEQLAGHLADRDVLLVLDNVEQVVDAAPLFSFLLQAAPKLVILVTSRATLHVAGERMISVPPLALPENETPEAILHAPAVQLFVERMRTINEDFTVDPGNAYEIRRMCSQLDGLPLAIELAAGQGSNLFSSFTPAHFEHGLPARHQTMRNITAWSYDLLTAREQHLLRHLSVFVGGFTLEAAEQTCDANGDANGAGHSVDTMLDRISSLIDQSLVQRLDETASGPRSHLLETIAEFGIDELRARGEEDAMRETHARWYLAFAERAEPELRGENQDIWVARIDSELGNLRAATEWFTSHGAIEEALRISGALGWYWSSPGHFHEGRDLFRKLLTLPGGEYFPKSMATVLESAGDIDDWLGDRESARTRYHQAIAIYQKLGNQSRVAGLTRGLASLALDDEEYATAIDLINGMMPFVEQDPWEHAGALNLLGIALFAQGEEDLAIASSQRAIALWEQLGDLGHVTTGLATLATFALGRKDADLARSSYARVLEMAEVQEDSWFRARSLAGIGGLAFLNGDLDLAARLLGTGELLTQRIGTPVRPFTQRMFDQFAAATRDALGVERFADEWSRGEKSTLDDLVAEASVYVAKFWSEPIAEPEMLPLTNRELEVLRMVAQGMSDRQIASELFIERGTASKHVESILAKLHVRSRAAAGTMAIRLGLIKD